MSKVEMYTKAFCPFCTRAKTLLAQKDIEIEEYPIDGDAQLREKMIQRANGGWTVPQIFINDVHVGGCQELLELERDNKLDALLAQ